MTVRALPPVRWNNPSSTQREQAAAQDLSALRAHYENCKGCKGRWFAIRCGVEAVHAFVSPRFVTTLVAVAGVATVLSVAAAAL